MPAFHLLSAGPSLLPDPAWSRRPSEGSVPSSLPCGLFRKPASAPSPERPTAIFMATAVESSLGLTFCLLSLVLWMIPHFLSLLSSSPGPHCSLGTTSALGGQRCPPPLDLGDHRLNRDLHYPGGRSRCVVDTH